MPDLSATPLAVWVILSIVGQLIGLATLIWKDHNARADRLADREQDRLDRIELARKVEATAGAIATKVEATAADVKAATVTHTAELHAAIAENTAKTEEGIAASKEASDIANHANDKLGATNEKISDLQTQLLAATMRRRAADDPRAVVAAVNQTTEAVRENTKVVKEVGHKP